MHDRRTTSVRRPVDRSTSPRRSDADDSGRGAQERADAARSSSPASRWRCSSSAGSPSISSSSCREVPLAETETNPLQRPLPDGIVPEDEVIRTENRWVMIMLGDARRDDGGHRRDRRHQCAAPAQQCRDRSIRRPCISGASSSKAISAPRVEPDGSVTVRLDCRAVRFRAALRRGCRPIRR